MDLDTSIGISLEIDQEELDDSQWAGAESISPSVRVTVLRRKRLAQDHPELLHAVSRTILRHDPFRLNYHSYNFDEYDGEAAEIIHMIAQGRADLGLMGKLTSMLNEQPRIDHSSHSSVTLTDQNRPTDLKCNDGW